jgi:hypothetical protein
MPVQIPCDVELELMQDTGQKFSSHLESNQRKKNFMLCGSATRSGPGSYPYGHLPRVSSHLSDDKGGSEVRSWGYS